MTDAKDENGNLLPDEIRLTRFGQFLRSTSIDELPELLNILRRYVYSGAKALISAISGAV